jgi:aminoglycoside phosphotransferase (APT) family kinase protein
MESLTKRRLNPGQLEALVTRMFGDTMEIVTATELTEGMFNAAYRLDIEPGIGTVVLKSSPPPEVPLLTYECDILRTEAAFYELGSGVPGVPLPRLLASDFSRDFLDGDVVVLSNLKGRSWFELRDEIDGDDVARLRHDLGEMVGALHEMKGTRFGYFQPGAAQGTTWREAFVRMVNDVLADAARFGVVLPVDGKVVRETFDRHASVMDAVATPSLVHFDLWEGNLLLTERGGRLEISGIIDAERAMWADPIADLVSVALFADIFDDRAFTAGYRVVQPGLDITPEVRNRLAMYRAYLDLIMLVEAVPRGYAVDEHARLMNAATEDLHRAIRHLSEAAPPA